MVFFSMYIVSAVVRFYHKVCICETHIQISITIHNFGCDLKNNIITRTAINWNHDNVGSAYK